ncbi:tartrate-resistant acid phosphatase type 5-like isoform X2 [Dysidea avara]|uniref:tartrate-resistant acid phosphatase type 5-like isoform X2 n=1 Tax=Dysidea avara TaxID=196820 RepID=UPI00333055CF
MDHFLSLIITLVFCCLTKADNKMNFVMLGDWGGQDEAPYYTPAQKEVATQMGRKAAETNSTFTIALGDNFYHYGVKDVDDPRFKETFERVFTAGSLQSRWYVIAGNHDHYGNASAEIAYTACSHRWYMPNYYYTETMTIPGTHTEIQFIFIDTVILAGNTHPTKTWLPPPGPESVNAAEDQWEWIEETLAASKADWLFVLGHYPVWSVALHGPTDVLVQRLRPLLMQYDVTAYFCGHDHNTQHIREENSTVEYVLTGAAHMTGISVEHADSIPANSLQYYYALNDTTGTYGAFTWVSISPTVMEVVYIDGKDGVHVIS